MYKKIKISLFTPSRIIELINDKWKSIWIYFFSMVMMLMIPTIIVNATEKGMTVFQYRSFSELVKNNNINAKIEEGILNTDTNFRSGFEQFDFYIDKGDIQVDMTSTHIVVLSKDKVSYYFRQMEVSTSTYESLGIKNYDFSEPSLENKVMFINAIDTFFTQHKASIMSLSLLVDFLGIVIETILIISIISLFNLKQVPFKYKFKVNVYAASIYALFNFMAVLFQVEQIAYVGIVLMFFYSNKAFSRVISIR